MPRTLPVLALLGLLVPGRPALAGPPEGVSGRIVLDEVWDGLRQYRAEKDPERRIRLLEKLAPSRDPRVAVVLGEAMESPAEVLPGGRLQISGESVEAHGLLREY